MIDLHCHLLPGIDDGPQSLEVSLEMARIAHADGIETTFCTPHIYPGLYDNKGPDIIRRVEQLQLILKDKGIALKLGYGADTHLVPGLVENIRKANVPTLGGSRYLLLEPPHHVRPQRFTESVFELVGAGYVPVITHPERLTWVADSYNDFLQLAKAGAWLQVTAGALTGRFGPFAKKYAEKFVGDGWTAVLATDAHTPNRRAPLLAEARERAERLLGAEESRRLVRDRPALVCDNSAPDVVVACPALFGKKPSLAASFKTRLRSLVNR
jgi:protein-tyrosine phosphatase